MASPSDKSTTESSGLQVTQSLDQAFQELAKGEKTAGLLEQNLSKIEDKLDAILAAMEAKQQQGQDQEQGGKQGKP